MRVQLLVVIAALSTLSAPAVVPTGSADVSTAEGWQTVGFPTDDYVPWNLLLQAKELLARDGAYVVVAGYLVVSPTSAIRYPNEEASHSGRTDGAIVLRRSDSPALRWLFGTAAAEGFYAVGGVLSATPKGPQLGHLTKIRFAMHKAPTEAVR